MEIIKTKIYGTEWDDRLFCLSLQFNDKGFITSQYRPPELREDFQSQQQTRLNNEDKLFSQEETQTRAFADSKNQEEAFLSIWTKFIIGLSVCSNEKDTLERNIGALIFTVMDTLEHKHVLTFDELLKYVDCFSMMLKEADLPDNEIKDVYLQVTQAVLKNFSNQIIDNCSGSKFISTAKYQEIVSLMMKPKNFCMSDDSNGIEEDQNDCCRANPLKEENNSFQ